MSPGECDSLYWTGIPKCICREDMENCVRARVLQSGCWDIYDCVPEFDDIRTGPVPDPGFWITDVDCQTRCFGWEPNMCDGCQSNIWDFGDGTTSTKFFLAMYFLTRVRILSPTIPLISVVIQLPRIQWLFGNSKLTQHSLLKVWVIVILSNSHLLYKILSILGILAMAKPARMSIQP